MIVADTSALISLATTDVLEIVLDEFEVHTTATVVAELEETASYDDQHATAAAIVLESIDDVTIHEYDDASLETSRIDQGEASCLALDAALEPAFFLTDDLRALPELQALSDAQVAISPIVLRALVKRGRLTNEDAREHLDTLVHTRAWLGTPIYRRALELFED